MAENIFPSQRYRSGLMGIARQLWKSLTEPSPHISKPQDKYRAQLLASLLLAGMATGIVALILSLFLDPDDSVFSRKELLVPILAMLGAFVVAYGCSRTRYFPVGAAITTLALIVLPFVAAVTSTNIGVNVRYIIYLVVPIALGSTLFSLRTTGLITVAIVMGVMAFPFIAPTVTGAQLFYPLTFVVISSILVIVFSWHREIVETDRLQQISGSEKQYRLLAENSSDIISRHSPDGAIMYLSPACHNILGYAPEELVGRLPAELVHPDDMSALTNVRLSRVPDSTVFTYRLRRKDGQYLWVESTCRFVRDSQSGAVSEIVIMTRDLSARKQTEEALRQSEQLYRHIFEKNPACILLIDPKTGAIVDASPGACEFYGYSRKQMRSMKLSNINTLSADVIAQNMMNALTHRQSHFLFEHRLASGELRDVEVHSGSIDRLGQTLLFSIIHDITERKKVENALAKERDLLNMLMDTIPDAIYQKDIQGRFIRINRAQGHNLGIGDHPEEAIGKTEFDFFDVDHSRRSSDDEQLIIATGKPLLDKMEQYTGVDGSEVWVSSTKVPVRDQNNKVIGIVGISRDVSTRKQTEDALRTSEEQLRSLIASMDDLIFSVDLNGRFLVYHEAARLTHDTPVTPSAKFVGRRYQDIFPADVVARLANAISLVMTTYSSQQIEYSLTENDREYFYSARLSPLVGHRMQLLGVTVVARDVTIAVQARQRQQRLYDLETLHRTITSQLLQAENPDEAVNLTLAQVGKFLDVSRAYVFQFRENERLFDNTHEWCAPGVPSEIGNLQSVAFDELVPSFLPLLMRDEIIAPRHISQLPEDMRALYEPQGIQSILMLPFYVDQRLQGFMGFDETRGPREWLPEEIAMIRTIIEGYSRTLERHRARMALIEARDTALRSAKLKSEFMSNMSHEIRTPMTGVLGMLELLQETELDEEQQDFATAAYRSAQNLLEIVDDILDFSKIEAGKIVLEATPVNLRGLVTEVRTTLLPQANKKGITLSANVGEDVPMRVFGDSTRLRQVLMNFTSNAVKFTSKGNVQIRVRQLLSLQGRTRLRFEVSDTGIGIKPEQVDRIFDSFVQADGSTTRRYGGTGLGLAISKQIVQLMGGAIDVTSIPDKGSTFGFTLTLPVAEDATEGRPLPYLPQLRLLVIDEESTSRYMLAQQLRLWGANIVELDNAEQLEITVIKAMNRGNPFHAVFLRSKPPLAEQTRRIDMLRNTLGAHTPQIIALLDDDALDAAEDSPYSALLRRPVRQSELYDILSYVQPDENVSTTAEIIEEPVNVDAVPSRVLLAEDNYMNREIVLRALRKVGLYVDIAADGREALGLLEKSHFDLILMDIHMPNMDGLEATRRIRAMPGSIRTIPIIALTASILPEEQQRYLDAGMNGVLSKPFSIDRLREVTFQWLKPAAR